MALIGDRREKALQIRGHGKHDGWIEVMRRSTLHAALEAAVRAVAEVSDA